MTREESDANAVRNEVIRRCGHCPFRCGSGRVVCLWCGCQFAVVMLPVLAEFQPFDLLEDE